MPNPTITLTGVRTYYSEYEGQRIYSDWDTTSAAINEYKAIWNETRVNGQSVIYRAEIQNPYGFKITEIQFKNQTQVYDSTGQQFAFYVESNYDKSGTHYGYTGVRITPGTNVQTIAIPIGEDKQFSDSRTVYIYVTAYADNAYIRPWDITLSADPPTLAISTAPQSLYAGAEVTIDVENRAGETITAVFSANGVDVESATLRYDSTDIDTEYAWFADAGVSGSSMQVTVTASDSLGRSATTRFTLQRPAALSATLTAPRNTTVSGASAVNFAWTYSGTGTQTKAEIQISRDDAVWTDLATIRSGSTVYTAAALTFPSGTNYWRVRLTSSYGVVGNWSNSARFTITYDAVSQISPVNSQTSGLVNATVAHVFSIEMSATGPVPTPFTIASATFYWRAGSSGEWTPLSMTTDSAATSASVTVPANTFSQGTVQWYAAATDNTGAAPETAVYTLTALIAEVQASPVRPINTVESGAGPITMVWTFGSVDGSDQAAAELEKSADGSTWELLASISGNATSWTAPAATFSAGRVFWRVRAKNSANVWGPWSAAVSFSCYGAPVVSGVSGDGKPFLTITWQTSGQLTFEIEVDGKSYGERFGANVRSYTLKEPLSNGLHTVRVRAMSKYTLWSQWAEASTSIENQPGSAFSLTAAVTGPDVVLGMSGNTASGPYYIYRDNKLIAKTNENAFTDRFATRHHVYSALQKLTGGYYTPATAEAAADISVGCPVIAALFNGNWILLELSEKHDREQAVTIAQEVAYVQYAGQEYPTEEIGVHRTKAIKLDVSELMENEDFAAAFQALIGKRVVVKTPHGELVVGVLQAVERRDPEWFRHWTFSVRQGKWKDFVDESGA